MVQENIQEKPLSSFDTIQRICQTLYTLRIFQSWDEVSNLIDCIERGNPQECLHQLNRLMIHLATCAHVPQLDCDRLLIIEDDPLIGQALVDELNEPNRQVLWATSVETALTLLREHTISLILLDLGLPDNDGRNLMVQMRQEALMKDVPIFVLSARTDVNVKVECFALGADMYFEKPVDPSLLRVTIASKLQRVKDFKTRSYHDDLTGLPNRIWLNIAFEQAIKLSARTHHPLSLALIDIDHFKQVNDLHGHSIGDRVLRHTTKVISRTLRVSDMIARWGGEEFVMIFPQTSPLQAKRALDKAKEELRNDFFRLPSELPLSLTFSAGVIRLTEGMTLEMAIVEADRHLYKAKTEGRDRIILGGG